MRIFDYLAPGGMLNPLYTKNPKKGTLANSKEQNEMPHDQCFCKPGNLGGHE